MKQIPLAEQLYRQQATMAGTLLQQAAPGPVSGSPESHKGWSCRLRATLERHSSGSGRCVYMYRYYLWFGRQPATRLNRHRSIRLLAGLSKQSHRQRARSGRLPCCLSAWATCVRGKATYSKAEELYRLATQEGDREGIASNNLAWLAAIKDKKYKEALDHVNRAIALKPDQSDFLDTRGMIYLLEGNARLALLDLQKAVAIDPLSPAKLFHLAQAALPTITRNRPGTASKKPRPRDSRPAACMSWSSTIPRA